MFVWMDSNQKPCQASEIVQLVFVYFHNDHKQIFINAQNLSQIGRFQIVFTKQMSVECFSLAEFFTTHRTAVFFI